MANFEPLLQGRSTVSQRNGYLSITIPSPKSIFVSLFLPVWLGGWTVGGVAAARAFIYGAASPNSNAGFSNGGQLFLGFWLCGWFLGESFAIYSLLWMFFGSENIRIDHTSLKYRWSILGIGQTKAYALSEVKNLRSIPTAHAYAKRGNATLDKGSVGFDYGRGTITMAKNIDPSEAESILAQIYLYNSLLKPLGH
jgi:hypothetical protein